MKKFLKQIFPRHKWWSFTLIGVVFFVFLHTGIFYWHQSLVHRYGTLHNQAVFEGTVLQVPVRFQEAQSAAQKRNMLTRPDILIQEVSILQGGIRSLQVQYRDEFNRLHDIIVDNIRILRALVQESQEYVFTSRDDISHLAGVLESELFSGKYVRLRDLNTLKDISRDSVTKAQGEFEFVRKKVILQDILALKHEIVFLDSYYRVTAGNSLVFSTKTLQKNFTQIFTKDVLQGTTAEGLGTLEEEFTKTLEPYRAEAKIKRAEAKIKRAAWVESEMKKWIETAPPVAPKGNIYSQIYVSLKQQKMYVYEDGDLILSTPITSGRRDFETIRGTFKIYSKERNHLMKSPFPDEEYELWVDYWMPFSGAYGIHDACNSTDCWRTRFGGVSYVYNGSHGCINTPYNAVKFIYNWARVGTTVYVD